MQLECEEEMRHQYNKYLAYLCVFIYDFGIHTFITLLWGLLKSDPLRILGHKKKNVDLH